MDSQGNPESSIQAVDLDKDTSTYEFFNLPKYERNGASVQYEVEEVWVDRQTGEALDKATIKTEYEGLYELIQQYNVSYKETKYETTADHAFDNQEISVSNRLTGTKDVLWHKQWKDDYAFRTNSRPDIYLDIYKTNHVKDANGDVTEEVSVYKTNYRWTYSSLDPEYDPDGKYDKKIHWHAELQDLPKYDSLGYEIFYFAVERSEILTTNFDYTAVQYGYPVTDPMGGPTEIGTEYDIPSEYVQHVRDVSDIAVEDPETKDNTPHYALKESGTFTNLLSAEVTIKGQKLWKSLPLKYPAIDLPTVDFKLYRQLKYGQEDTGSKGDDQTGQDKDETDVRENPQREEVASIRVSDWAAINKNGTYIFDVLYEGVNTMNVNPDTHEVTISGEPGAKRLPKYDEDGRLYAVSYTHLGRNSIFPAKNEGNIEFF